MANLPSVQTLKAILNAFNAHDLDRIMSFFSDDCVLEMPRGPEPWGSRSIGAAAVSVSRARCLRHHGCESLPPPLDNNLQISANCRASGTAR